MILQGHHSSIGSLEFSPGSDFHDFLARQHAASMKREREEDEEVSNEGGLIKEVGVGVLFTPNIAEAKDTTYMSFSRPGLVEQGGQYVINIVGSAAVGSPLMPLLVGIGLLLRT